MARNVSIAEARDHLTALLREVERGTSVQLTRRGVPVAVLVSSSEYARLRADKPSALEALRAWQKSTPPDFQGLSAAEVAAVRDRAPGRDVGL